MAVETSATCQSSRRPIGSLQILESLNPQIPKSSNPHIANSNKSSNPHFLKSLISVSTALSIGLAVAMLAAQASLKIIVVAGEDAVNIIQQRTSVAPMVEVRDRNDLPVAGALVTFRIGGGNATFGGGLQSLTVATNTAGRAAASAPIPTGTGTLQIDVVATYQGNTAAATITQTNFATPVDAARAGRATAAAAGGTLAAAGGSTGGGLSPVVIGALAGGAGAGALVAASALRNDSGDNSVAPSGAGTTYAGTASGTMSVNYTFVNLGVVTLNCTGTRRVTANMSISLSQSGGTVTGQGAVTGTQIETAVTGSPGCTPSNLPVPLAFVGAVTGTTANLMLTAQNVRTGSTTNAGRVMTETFTERLTFAGSLSGSTVTGTISLNETSTCTSAGASCGGSSGTTAIAIMLR